MSLLSQIRTGGRRLAAESRALYQAQQLRAYAEAAKPAQDDDIVLSSFRKQQQQYQQLMQGLQSITLPLTGDEAAVKKYAGEVEALKKRIGMPDVEEVIDAELEYKFASAGYDIRKFVLSALEGLELGPAAGVLNELLGAVDEAERASGAPLDAANDKGWAVLTQRIEALEAKYGLGNKAAVRDEAIFDLYKKHIAVLKAQVEADMDKARQADGLDFIQPDVAALKPKLT
eukprot:scaffold3.g6295.t1